MVSVARSFSSETSIVNVGRVIRVGEVHQLVSDYVLDEAFAGADDAPVQTQLAGG